MTADNDDPVEPHALTVAEIMKLGETDPKAADAALQGIKLAREARDAGKVGGVITFGDVLAVGTDEKKFLSGSDAAKAKVVGKIVEQGRHPKVTVCKFKTCNQYKIVRGHRQNYTAVEVSGIEL